ncbi:MAG TPA: alpha/beta fold hydrolase [Acidimicrobiia bacterium]|nr:alpha/beta fold hydrolase [Acidimicrobiia bacterium]
MAQPFHTQLAVPVAGGSLAVGVAGAPLGDPDVPIVVLVHGITGSHRSWAPVARRLGHAVTVLAPDLRGRGQSSGIDGPFGMAAHVADLLAVLDRVECPRAVLAGHSMGAYVVARFAATAPDRLAATVMVDGGLPLPVPPGMDPDVLLAAVLGPSLGRLEMTFASVEDYRGFWRAHPAFAPFEWTDDIVDYVDYDLGPPAIDPEGGETAYRSRVSQAAVRADGRDLLDGDGARKALEAVVDPAVLLWAARGLQNEDRPLLPAEAVAEARALLPGLAVIEVPDTNHYLILLGDREAAVVAGEIRRLATS